MLSIIITAYNMEKYIKKCIISVCNQSYSDIEVIVVDDGSEDPTLSICTKCEQQDHRIKVIHQDNSGLVSARKRGLSNAKGKYVTFVDGDDWIEPNIYEKMMQHAKKNVDMITAGTFLDYENYSEIAFDYFSEGRYDKDAIEEIIIPQMAFVYEKNVQGLSSSVCNKIFKRDLLLKVMEGMDNQITLGEDAAIVFPFVLNSGAIYVSREIGYHYVQRDNSMIHTNNLEALHKIKLLKNYLDKKMKYEGVSLAEQTRKYLSYHLMPIVKELYDVGSDEWWNSFLLPPQEYYYKKKVVVYGAGEKGKYYIRTLKAIGNVNVVLWVDTNADNLGDYRVKHPNSIETVLFDYIIIAIDDEEICLDIKMRLIDDGISPEKIVY